MFRLGYGHAGFPEPIESLLASIKLLKRWWVATAMADKLVDLTQRDSALPITTMPQAV
jgi:hypothetical protein